MEEKTRKRLMIHVTTITTGKPGKSDSFGGSTKKKQKQTTFILTEFRKLLTLIAFRLKTERQENKKKISLYDRFLEFHFATLVPRQLEKKQTNLRLEKFVNSTNEI